MEPELRLRAATAQPCEPCEPCEPCARCAPSEAPPRARTRDDQKVARPRNGRRNPERGTGHSRTAACKVKLASSRKDARRLPCTSSPAHHHVGKTLLSCQGTEAPAPPPRNGKKRASTRAGPSAAHSCRPPGRRSSRPPDSLSVLPLPAFEAGPCRPLALEALPW